MSKLTKAQRNRVYKEALKIIKSNASQFCCTAIDISLWKLGFKDYRFDEICEIMPEFGSFKPKLLMPYDTWFHVDDKQARIDCLTKCIELTNSKNVKK